jgi:hypothetical protein
MRDMSTVQRALLESQEDLDQEHAQHQGAQGEEVLGQARFPEALAIQLIELDSQLENFPG